MQVNASTITRFLRGEIHKVEAFTENDVMFHLGLDAMQRKQFLQLTAAMGISFLLKPQKVAMDMTLEVLDGYAESLRHNLENGHPGFVYEKAKSVFAFLEYRYPASNDPLIVKQHIQFGLLQANAQEAYFPWYQRAHRTVAIHNLLFDRYLARFPERGDMTQEYIRLLERRAPLYRELTRHEEGLADFEHALSLAREDTRTDPEMLVTLLRNKAHIYAVIGEEREWQTHIHLAERIAAGLPPERSLFHRGLIAYSLAEGYKRLAYRFVLPISSSLRLHYVRQALQAFEKARNMVQNARPAHYMLSDVSAAQTLIWLDPEAALLRLHHLRDEVQVLEPALLNKIQRSEKFARLRLQTSRNQEEVLFNLDHR